MTSIWLHESDFRYVNLDVERYQKKYRLTLTNGNKYVFIKDKEDISDVNPFIPYILMEEGMNNVLVKSD
ncbi:toxin-coregulated pilus protein TcpR, partial [Vibrio cholerae]|nr:toxin-coregulated pilus protein TcpR [Vibrio cholerae]